MLLFKVTLPAILPAKKFTITEDGWDSQSQKEMLSRPQVKKDRRKATRLAGVVLHHLSQSWNQSMFCSYSLVLLYWRIPRLWTSFQRNHVHIAAGSNCVRIQPCKHFWPDSEAQAVQPNTEAWFHVSHNYYRSVHLQRLCKGDKMHSFPLTVCICADFSPGLKHRLPCIELPALSAVTSQHLLLSRACSFAKI